MAHTLGITGMDSATEAALRASIQEACAHLAQPWQIVSESAADHVVVDMDSMYGPMSWIRLHAAGKRVIGLTTSPRTQADLHLARPFDAASVAAVLAAIAGQTAPMPDEDATLKQADAPPSSATPAPAPAEQLPEEQLLAPDEEANAPAEPAAALEPTHAEPFVAAQPMVSAADSAPEAESPPACERGFADWLLPGALSGRWKLARDEASVVFDADARTYHAPTALKPLAALFAGAVTQEDFEALDQDAWSAQAGGGAQPLARLQWLGGLLAGNGALLPGNDPEGQYRLVKWPQTEREFPRHFRIATAMMKGPATLAEIAAASGVPAADVADFVNANLATGFAEFVPPPPPEATEAPRSGGLLGRLRGR